MSGRRCRPQLREEQRGDRRCKASLVAEAAIDAIQPPQKRLPGQEAAGCLGDLFPLLLGAIDDPGSNFNEIAAPRLGRDEET